MPVTKRNEPHFEATRTIVGILTECCLKIKFLLKIKFSGVTMFILVM